MKIEIEKLPSIRITLENQEAAWLRDFIQNYPGDPSNEFPLEAQMRKKLFDELSLYLS